jgi:hypothetical protein
MTLNVAYFHTLHASVVPSIFVVLVVVLAFM